MLQRAAGLATAILLLGFVADAHALQITLDQSFGSDPASGPIVLDISAAADGSYVDITMDVSALSSPRVHQGALPQRQGYERPERSHR